MRALAKIAIGVAAASSALAPAVSAPDKGPPWIMQRSNNGVMFTMSPESGPEGVRLGLFCNGAKPSMVAIVDGETAPRLKLGIYTEEGEVAADLSYQANSKTYGGPVPGVIAELLTGKAASALISINGVQYFNLSLAGASANVTKALASCWTRPAQPTIKPALPVKGALGPLGIAPGHYVSAAVPCNDPFEVFFYDGKRAGMVDPEGKYPLRPVGKVTRNADGSLFLEAHEIELRRLSGGRISLTIQDITPPMRVCPAATLPKAWRVK